MDKHLVEIKARSTTHAEQRQTLLDAGARFHGTDHQVDHYFRVPEGRLKLRRGTIERSLIFYARGDQAGPKDSSVSLTRLFSDAEAADLAATLDRALGTWVTVDKQREIYFIDNVKFHFDTVAGLGTFTEIEAIGDTPDEHDRLRRQVDHFVDVLQIRFTDLVAHSYSDLLTASP